MSIRYNSLIFKGKSSADFPFDVFVQQNDGINKAKRRSSVFSNNSLNGGITRDFGTYEPIEKSYSFYVHGVDVNQMGDFLAWLDGEGKMIAYDNPDRYYEVLTVDSFKSKLDEVGGYEFEVVFTCNPFSYPVNDDVITITSGGSVNNTSSSVMFPKVTVYGNSSENTTVTIGKQVVHLKSIDTKLVIECKPGEQNVYDKNGNLINSMMKGAFFEVPKGRQGVVLGKGIDRIEIVCRWGAFG